VYVAELSAAGLPLAPGLRAAAEEVGGGLALTLHGMADAIDRGQSLENAFTAHAAGFPHYLQGLVRAALHTGQLGETLIDLVEHRRAAREQWRTVVSALSYPAILFTVTAVLFLGMAWFIAPTLRDLYEDFELEVPLVTVWIVFVGSYAATFLIGAAVALASIMLARLVLGAVRWRRVVAAVPLFGPLWRWTAVAEMARLLAALVKRQVALPDALRLTASGLYDANLAGVCRELANEVEQGRDLALLIALSPRLPASLAPLVRWGQISGRLDEAFESAAEMFEGRVRLRASLLRTVLPPFVFLAAAALALTLFVGALVPSVNLIQNLW
jgi:type II secretory pathway component PulF